MPRTTAWRPSVCTWAPMRLSSAVNTSRLSKTFSVTIPVPSATASAVTAKGMKSVAKPGNGRVCTSIPCGRPSITIRTPSTAGSTRAPRSTSLSAATPRCSTAMPSTVTSPPAMTVAKRYVPPSMRSPMTAWSAGTSSSTPSMVIVCVPAPSMRAPIFVRNAARSEISGSRAALSITVSPFASTAAVMSVSVAPTLGKSSTTRAPHSALTCASMNPCTTSSSTPIAWRPRVWRSSLRLPMLSPPGIATRARPWRASSGPSTLIDARMRLTSSYGASGTSGPVASTRSASSPSQVTGAPIARRSSHMTSRSATGWRLRTVETPGHSSAAASCLQPAFLVMPAARTVPASGPAGRTW